MKEVRRVGKQINGVRRASKYMNEAQINNELRRTSIGHVNRRIRTNKYVNEKDRKIGRQVNR